MDLRRYSHIVALADDLHYGRAADRLGLSQPALSRSIQAAEQDLGVRLFERHGGQVRCTAAGEFVVARARALMLESRRFERDTALYRDKQMGDLIFGMGRFAAATFLPPMLQRMRARYPGVRIRAHATHLARLATLLRHGEVDFYVADARSVAPDPEVAVERLGRLSVDFYVRAGHPLASDAPLRLADLMAFGLATGPLPGHVQQAMAATLGLTSAQSVPFAVECDDALALKAIMLSTDTVLYGSAAQLATELASGQARLLRPADFEPAASHIAIISERGRELPPIATEALVLLREIAAVAMAGAA